MAFAVEFLAASVADGVVASAVGSDLQQENAYMLDYMNCYVKSIAFPGQIICNLVTDIVLYVPSKNL